MALVPLRTLLDHAAENNYGVAAFNVNNMEQIQAITWPKTASDVFELLEKVEDLKKNLEVFGRLE